MVVSVFALLQIRLLVIPVLIALILAAAIMPFVNLLKRRGLPASAATAVAFVALLAVLAGVTTVIVASIRSQWGDLASQASSGLDELQSFLLNGPIPVDGEQIEQARAAIVEFAASSQVRSGAITGLSVITEFLAGASLMVVILFFFLKDGAAIWNFFLRPYTGAREAKLRRSGARTIQVLGDYVRGTAIVALVDTVAIGTALLVLQVPLAIPLAIIVFIGAFVPIVGATVAGILAALVALVANGPVVALIVVDRGDRRQPARGQPASTRGDGQVPAVARPGHPAGLDGGDHPRRHHRRRAVRPAGRRGLGDRPGLDHRRQGTGTGRLAQRPRNPRTRLTRSPDLAAAEAQPVICSGTMARHNKHPYQYLGRVRHA